MRFFSPFETNVRCIGYPGAPGDAAGWRWYHRFLSDYPNMVRTVESDCFDCLIERGLVVA